MKLNKLFLLAGIALAGFTMSSCSDDDDWAPGAQAPAGADDVFISGAVSTTYEKDPSDAQEFDVTFARVNHETEQTAKIEVVTNDSNVFIVPETITFSGTDSLATITVKADTAKLIGGITYKLELRVAGDNVNPYSKTQKSSAYYYTMIKWESIGKGYIYGAYIDAFFGVDPVLMQIPNIEKAVTASDTRYRFHSPFAEGLGEEEDQNGAVLGYPYNDPGDLDGSDNTWLIRVFSPTDVRLGGTAYCGMDWGYGSFYFTQQSTRGTFKEDVITFPPQSLGIFMASYGGRFTTSNIVFYLSEKAYLKAVEAAKESEE